MAAVGLSREAVASYLSRDVVLACENGPDSVTISGDKHTLESVTKQIQADHPHIIPVSRALGEKKLDGFNFRANCELIRAHENCGS
jgi:acyl transferase domain-containing protein